MTARFKLLVSEAWRSLGANLSTTVAATMTVLISMFMLGLFIGFGTWMDSWSTHVKSELLVKIYFTPNATMKAEEHASRRSCSRTSTCCRTASSMCRRKQRSPT